MSDTAPTAPSHPGLDSLERLEELVSLMLDDALKPEAVAEIEQLLGQSEEARRRYIDLTQLHGELLEFFRPAKGSDSEETKATGIVAGALDLSSFGGDASMNPSDSGIG